MRGARYLATMTRRRWRHRDQRRLHSDRPARITESRLSISDPRSHASDAAERYGCCRLGARGWRTAVIAKTSLYDANPAAADGPRRRPDLRRSGRYGASRAARRVMTEQGVGERTGRSSHRTCVRADHVADASYHAAFVSNCRRAATRHPPDDRYSGGYYVRRCGGASTFTARGRCADRARARSNDATT